ncbi:MAG: P-II family nitrogen regulator [Fimbriimonadaceae bacterium]|jgi:nitrogen regulatory protein PII|nr:P-II family nitrogen regulator [Fimbriimonadaceae bacterium]
MKRIEAIVRINKLEDVKLALEDIGVYGLTCDQVRGYGRQQGQTDLYRGSTYALNLIPKMRIVVVTRDSECEQALEAIVQASHSGEIGDGKIFVSEVLDVVRIRTGERGEAALL